MNANTMHKILVLVAAILVSIQPAEAKAHPIRNVFRRIGFVMATPAILILGGTYSVRFEYEYLKEVEHAEATTPDMKFNELYDNYYYY